MALAGPKKRVSKKSKASWRKHVDIKDVDEFLDDKRLQERLGKEFSLRTNDELFKVDEKPSDVQLSSKRSKRLALQKAPLKCFAMLESHSKVSDPIAKRNRVRTKLERQKGLVDRYVKVKDKIIKRQQKLIKKGKENKDHEEQCVANIWNENDDPLKSMPEWLNKDCVKHNLRNSGRTIKTVPKSVVSKQVFMSAVEAPHPGMSYNPSVADHRNLLKIIVDKEKELIKQEVHLNRVTSKFFRKVSPSQKEKDMLAEMSEGLPKTVLANDADNDDKSESSESENDENGNPAVKNKKKDLKQKRKAKEQRILKLQLRKARVEKKKVADIYKLKKLAQKIAKAEEIEKKVQEKRKIKQEEKSKGTKVLGKVKFEEPELEFNMKKEIAGNLRNVKKEGNLLLDRFKSLQKRNVIEPTVSQGLRKRSKVKRFTKKSHQDV
ncbi:ribosome biogenesis protein NOP53-like [Ctenocephalides felis]|uniref:ribosome biogenesis protein NOP53-like n=1 Tax=Ctenocephalides felis TaxID=7515 RepID=UPI000E6E2600|nr:ribosome biogenesis protein NOP53-like [Ctenocephalides felis]